jgi:hypothetical protein
MSEFVFDPDPIDPTKARARRHGAEFYAGPQGEWIPVRGNDGESAHDQILDTLTVWAARHPAPDQPALSIASLGEYSPRALRDAVEKRTEVGRFFETMIIFGANRVDGNLRTVLSSFLRENSSEGSANLIQGESL